MTPTTKIASAVVAGVLGLAVTGAAAMAAFQPSEPAQTTAGVDAATTAVQQDKGGIRDHMKDALDKLVQNGTITQTQEDAVIAALRGAAKNGKDGDRDDHHVLAGVLKGLMKASADYLGLPPGQLKQQLASGKSLAQIAGATDGKSRQGLIDALTADATAKIDQLVQSGKITADRAAKLKAQLPDRLAKFVDHTFTPKAPKPTT